MLENQEDFSKLPQLVEEPLATQLVDGSSPSHGKTYIFITSTIRGGYWKRLESLKVILKG